MYACVWGEDDGGGEEGGEMRGGKGGGGRRGGTVLKMSWKDLSSMPSLKGKLMLYPLPFSTPVSCTAPVPGKYLGKEEGGEKVWGGGG